MIRTSYELEIREVNGSSPTRTDRMNEQNVALGVKQKEVCKWEKNALYMLKQKDTHYFYLWETTSNPVRELRELIARGVELEIRKIDHKRLSG